MDNSTNPISEKLVQYLDNELAGIEKEKLQQQLASDNSLQQEFDNLQLARGAVKSYGLKQKISGIHTQMMEEMKSSINKNKSTAAVSISRRFRYMMAAAASIILIAGSILAYSFYSLSSDKVFTSNYMSYELSTVRGENEPAISLLEKAYQDKQYQKVIELQQPNAPLPIKETFLVAVAYLETGNNTSAIVNFKKVIAENETAKTTILKDEAEYNLALTYIRNKDYKLAIELLNTIRNSPAHLYHEKASAKLIRQVKTLKMR
jgi:tetratricopeptide (TPR) repeat protein